MGLQLKKEYANGTRDIVVYRKKNGYYTLAKADHAQGYITRAYEDIQFDGKDGEVLAAHYQINDAGIQAVRELLNDWLLHGSRGDITAADLTALLCETSPQSEER